MKTMLRQLRFTVLSHLAYVLGVLRPNMTEKELVDTIATYCEDNRLQWSDLLSRFTFLQRPDTRKEIMTTTTDQTGTPRANSRTKRLSPLRDTNPVSDLDAPIEGLSSSARAVIGPSPHARAVIALQVDLTYYKEQSAGAHNEEEIQFCESVIKELTHSIEVLQRESINEMKKGTPR